jgi:hypothetical protein
VHSDGSYCSSSDPRVLFGLGDAPEITKVQAHWVSGRVEEWTGLPVGKYTTLREGTGTAKGGLSKSESSRSESPKSES